MILLIGWGAGQPVPTWFRLILAGTWSDLYPYNSRQSENVQPSDRPPGRTNGGFAPTPFMPSASETVPPLSPPAPSPPES